MFFKNDVETIKTQLSEMDDVFKYYKQQYNTIVKRKYKKAIKIILSGSVFYDRKRGVYRNDDDSFLVFKYNNPQVTNYGFPHIVRLIDFHACLNKFEFPKKETKELFDLCEKLVEDK